VREEREESYRRQWARNGKLEFGLFGCLGGCQE